MKLLKVALVATLIGVASPAFALPTFQTYIDGATSGSWGPDEQTWYGSGDPFTLYVVGAYGPNTVSLTGVTLLVSVPDGETGTISISTSDETPTLLTLTGQGMSTPETNPTTDADTHVLTDVAGANGYSTRDFLPEGANINNHYPIKNDVSDFLVFDLGSFDNSEGPLNNYNAADGTITSTSAFGEQKEYDLSISGFSWVHFDAYGLVTDELGNHNIKTTWDWEISPGSHDSTYGVPEPSSVLLLGAGLLSLGLLRRRSSSACV